MTKIHHQGITLFFAVIVTAALLLAGISIIRLVSKEFTLSFFNRESQQAFYSADAIAECVLYWDSKGPPTAPGNSSGSLFSTTSSVGTTYDFGGNNGTVPTPATCNALPMPVTFTASTTAQCGATKSATIYGGTFSLSSVAETFCATVTVSKMCSVVGGVNTVITDIDARGYNTCNTKTRARVERALQITY